MQHSLNCTITVHPTKRTRKKGNAYYIEIYNENGPIRQSFIMKMAN